MDYVVTFEDGSSGYLAHHGIKGMKWGVWNAETKARRTGSKPMTARKYTKSLNKLDNDLKAATIAGANNSAAMKKYQKAAKKAEIKGNEKRAFKMNNKAEFYQEKLSSVSKYKTQKGKELVDTLTSLEKEGYTWKARQTNFSGNGLESIPSARRLNKATGAKTYPKYLYEANASSGNRFKVKEASKLSPTKKRLWKETRQNINSYRPQQYEVYYY